MHDTYTGANRGPGGMWPLLIEAIAGAATGVLLVVSGGYLGPVLVRGFENGWNDLVASVVGMLIGYMAGAPLGVVASARLLNQRGVAWRAWLGSAIGGIAIMLLAEPLRINQHPWLLMAIFASAALVGALAGFRKKGT